MPIIAIAAVAAAAGSPFPPLWPILGVVFMVGLVEADRAWGRQAPQKKDFMILAEVKGDKTCCICRDPLKKGTKEAMLPCIHMFHRKCITDWLTHKRECPICKHSL